MCRPSSGSPTCRRRPRITAGCWRCWRGYRRSNLECVPANELPTRPLGDSGLEVSVVGLGCNNFGRRMDLEATRAVVDAAIAEGVTFFDTADIYGLGASEEFLG